MGTLSAMSGLLFLQPAPHEATQPLKVALVVVGLPAAPCALPKLGCASILDTTAVSGDVASHVGGDGGGGGGGDEGGGA